MAEFIREQILSTKSKIAYSEGFNTLVFVDGKFREFIDKPKVYSKGTKIVDIPSTSFKILWGTREKLTFSLDTQMLHVGLSGEFEIEITNPRKFYNNVLLTNKQLTLTQLQALIVPSLVNQLDLFLKQYIEENNLKIINLETYKTQLSRNARLAISQKLESQFGISCKNFLLQRVLFDDSELEKIKKLNITSVLKRDEDNKENITIEKSDDLEYEENITNEMLLEEDSLL